MLRHSLGGRGVWGRMDARICMAESLCCPPETILTLLIDYPQYKVESKKKEVSGTCLCRGCSQPLQSPRPWSECL